MGGVIMVLVLFGFGILCAIAIGISALISSIQDKIEKKKRDKLIADYPELKLLLSEYMRLTHEHGDTCASIYRLTEEIDKWVKKNEYLPLDKKVDGHIEQLKVGLWELEQIRQTEKLEVELAKKKLELFWTTNFPNLKEEKRIMWWYW